MARHSSFTSEFKRRFAKEFLDGRAGQHELARRYSISRNLIQLWVRKYEAGWLTDEKTEPVRGRRVRAEDRRTEREVGQRTMGVSGTV